MSPSTTVSDRREPSGTAANFVDVSAAKATIQIVGCQLAVGCLPANRVRGVTGLFRPPLVRTTPAEGDADV